MEVPFVDLKAQYRSIKPEIDRAIKDILDTTRFVGGPPVSAFETAFAEFAGAKHCIGVANGTDAIYAVLRALGIGPGDEVITVANSWISTSETISQTGAKPVFVDIDEFCHIDPLAIERRINRRTRAVIPVHLYGLPAAIEEIAKVCANNGLHLVEDCAQAHGAEFNGRPVGTFGIAGTFSFYPGKNLGAYGDAGAVITSDDALASRVRMFCNHGALQKHKHEIEGINSRLDSLQAAVLTAKLPHLPGWTNARRRVAESYHEQLAGVDGLHLPATRPGSTHVYHLFVIRTPHRDALMAHLRNAGVATQIHYPTALPLLPAYSYLGYGAEDVPRAARYQGEILSLPMYPELTDDMIRHVSDSIKAFQGGIDS